MKKSTSHNQPFDSASPWVKSLSQRVTGFFGLSLELLTLMFTIRLVVDTSNRIFMPFIPQLASGLGLTITAFSWMLALRSLTGLFSPLMGALADRFGRRAVMVAALVLRGFGFWALAFSNGWWSVLPMLLVGLSTSAYLPVQKAYVSDQVPYERRGRALAAVDASFPTAGMVGLPVVGWMMEVWSWQPPFYVLTGLSFLAALLMMLRLPKTPQRTHAAATLPGLWRFVCQPRIFASVAVAIIQIFTFSLFMTFWALWLSADFGLGPLEIGWMGTWIGIAEFAGLLLAGLFIDRIGKRRGSLVSLAASALLCALIPFSGDSLWVIGIVLMLAAVAIEFALTATIPLFAEQAPGARAMVFSLVAFGNTIGIGLGPPVTTYLLAWKGVGAVILAAVLSAVLTFFLVWRFLHDQPAAARELCRGRERML